METKYTTTKSAARIMFCSKEIYVLRIAVKFVKNVKNKVVTSVKIVLSRFL